MKKIGLIVVLIIILGIGGYIWMTHMQTSSKTEHSTSSQLHKNKVNQTKKDKPKTKSHVDKVLDSMTLEEKIGQLIIAGVDGTSADKATQDLVKSTKVGGMILYANNMETPEQTVQLLNDIKSANQKNDVPILLGLDQEGGDVSRLPGGLTQIPKNAQIGAQNDEQYARTIGHLLGKEVHDFGFNINFAPVMDVNSNPNNPVIGERSYGDDPDLVGKLGIQEMQGIEQEGIVPVIKHFPGHGDTSVDSHLALPKVDKDQQALEELELKPFKKAIKQGTDAVMVAHILLPQIDPDYPASMSKKVVNGILRDQLGYDGVVMTDDTTMQAITDHFDTGEATVDAIKAGNDIVMVAHDEQKSITAIKAIRDAVKNGDITEDRIDKSVKRIIKLKEKYKMRDDQTSAVSIDELNQQINAKLK